MCLSKTTVGDPRQFGFRVEDSSHMRYKVSKGRKKAGNKMGNIWTLEMAKIQLKWILLFLRSVYSYYKMSSSKHLRKHWKE